MRSIVTALLVLSSAACATTRLDSGTKRYNAPTLTIPQVRDELFRTVDSMVRDQGWTVVTKDRASGRIEALSQTDSSYGVAMRERWVFAVTDFEVVVARTLEAQLDDGGVWEHGDMVCQGYVYLREHEVLAALERRATRSS